ncbi:diguanylate cyclase [Vibrio rotiferianus]|nr:diguanylate cyclase [Vibrio rotiferianus]
MAFPKLLIRILRPYLVILAGLMIYLAHSQFVDSETMVYRQSQTNLITADRLIRSQIEATFSKFYLLERALRANNNNLQSDDFLALSDGILDYSPQYSNILFTKSDGEVAYDLSNQVALADTSHINWHKLDTISDNFYISSLYPNLKQEWVFAVKHVLPNSNAQLWIEFNLLHSTQQLRGLKTLSKGYVFVVDRDTGRLVFHPNPSRIGDKSISFHGGIHEKVASGLLFGKHEYYYQDHFKVSVFDADNSLNWVFVAGTDRADILSSSYQFTLTAAVIASLLALAIIINYLTYQLHLSLAKLNSAKNIGEFKARLKSVLHRFCFDRGIQFCVYDSINHGFYTLDYHGNKKLTLSDAKLAASFSQSSISYRSKKYSDVLAQKLKVHGNHYCIPLFDGQELLAVTYVCCRFPTYKCILNLIQNYAQIALANLKLHDRLRHQDPMTQLENKACLATKVARELGSENRFIAMIDIDNFKYINDKYGHPVGDLVIQKTAEVMRDSFPKPKGICLARYGGEEFAVVFQANDEFDAKHQLDGFLTALQRSHLSLGCGDVRFTASVGFTPLETSYHHVVEQADKALYQAKRLGKNRVCHLKAA